MKTTSKIIVTIGAILAWFIISLLLIDARNSSGHVTPGPFGIVLLFGLIAGLRAIWKKSPKKIDKNDDEMHLDKTA